MANAPAWTLTLMAITKPFDREARAGSMTQSGVAPISRNALSRWAAQIGQD